MSFEEGMAAGLIEYVGEDCYEALYQAIESRSVRPGLCKTAGLKLVYSPLNGSGLVPVTRVLGDIGITDITIVPEQKDPDGNFPHLPLSQPGDLRGAPASGSGAGREVRRGPDAGPPTRTLTAWASPCAARTAAMELLSGNEVGVLLLDYICKARIENGTMPKDPVMVKSIVSTPLADVVAAHYGVECRNVLTGFKWIGDQIARLEAAGQVERFIFGFEESYGYLAGSYVRDKDASIGSMLICEMAAYYRSIGSSIKEELDRIYAEYGRYLNKVDSYEFPGLSGMDRCPASCRSCVRSPRRSLPATRWSPCPTTRPAPALSWPPARPWPPPARSQCADGTAPRKAAPPWWFVLRHRAQDQDLLHHSGKECGDLAQAQKDALAAALKPILA